MTDFKRLAIAMNLSPLCKQIVAYMEKAGSISARDAALDLDITSASLTRRLTDIENAGIKIERTSRKHPVTKKRFTRYAFETAPATTLQG